MSITNLRCGDADKFMEPSILDARRNSVATSLFLCIPLGFRVPTHVTLMGCLPVPVLDARVRHSFHDLHLVQVLHFQSTCFPHLYCAQFTTVDMIHQIFETPACCGLERCVAMDDSLCLLLSLSVSSSVSLFLLIVT